MTAINIIYWQVFSKFVNKWITIASPFQGNFLNLIPFTLLKGRQKVVLCFSLFPLSVLPHAQVFVFCCVFVGRWCGFWGGGVFLFVLCLMQSRSTIRDQWFQTMSKYKIRISSFYMHSVQHIYSNEILLGTLKTFQNNCAISSLSLLSSNSDPTFLFIPPLNLPSLVIIA